MEKKRAESWDENEISSALDEGGGVVLCACPLET